MKRSIPFFLTACLASILLGCSGNMNAADEDAPNEKSERVDPTDERMDITASFPAYSWEEKNELSTLIVEGVPIKIVEEYETSYEMPFTRFAFKIDHIYKGKAETEIIELLQEGNSTIELSNHPLLEIGEKYILFLETSSNDNLIMVGGPTSKFKFDPSEKRYVNSYNEKIDTHNGEKLTYEGVETLKTVSGREIIAELEQTAKETPKRDEKVVGIIESEDYKSGILGEPSKALEEDMAVQSIEFGVVMETIEKVYGGHEEFDKSGVIFLENQMQEAVQSGIWLGVKEADEKVDALIRELQPQVDAGEILAEPIYIYRSPHSQVELNTLQDEVWQALQPMGPKRKSGQVSMDIITGDIQIGHDFLKETRQVELREKFAGHTIHFEQLGRMVAENGESIFIYPLEKMTTKAPTKGGYVVQADKEQFLVTGGDQGAVYYEYPGEMEQLEVGQRVVVESMGGIKSSYPGQGTAKYVEILPVYQPENATLSEVDVVQQAVAHEYGKSNRIPHVHSITYDQKMSKWQVSILKDEETYEIEIKDQ